MNNCARRLGEEPRIRPRKSLGQNFLVDLSHLETILGAAEIGPDDAVLEIGAGTGVLTEALAREAGHVTAVEVDRRLVGLLRRRLAGFPNVHVVEGDILRLSLTGLLPFDKLTPKMYKVVGNLPYYITSPAILKLLEEARFCQRIVVLVQKEVAERMVAAPGSKRYGAFSVVVQYHADPRIVGIVPPEAFWPTPKVTSAVVRLDVRSAPRVDVRNEDLFFAIVRAGFRMRRKTLLRALALAARAARARRVGRAGRAGRAEGASAGLEGASEQSIREALAKAGICPERRAETLGLEEFGALADAIYEEAYRRNPGGTGDVHQPD